MKKIIFSAFMMVSLSAQAGQVTIPNTFTAGTKALASDVNGNFTAVKTAVDDNDLRITATQTGVNDNYSQIQTNTAQINANTLAIGNLALTMPTTYQVVDVYGSVAGDLTSMTSSSLTFISNQGYYASYISNGGMYESFNPVEVSYATIDCTGPMYFYMSFIPGRVFTISVPGMVGDYYLPKNAVQHTISANSREVIPGTGACTALASPMTVSGHSSGDMLLNDPAVTGIPRQASLTFPLSVQAK